MQRARSLRTVSALLPILGVLHCSDGVERTARQPRPATAAPDDPLLSLVDESNAPSNAARQIPLPEADPYSLLTIAPTSGPYAGGQRALIRGRGFGQNIRVWIGPTEVPPELVFASRADRLQIAVPPGAPGPSDVSVQNGEDATTRRTLPGAYSYEAFAVQPEQGPTSGGTPITLSTLPGTWQSPVEVTVDGFPCPVTDSVDNADSAQQLTCLLPPGTEGLKPISVVSGETVQTVLSAFRYVPAVAPRGGLSGSALSDRLQVTAVAPNGAGIAGATIIVGSNLAPASPETEQPNVLVADDQGTVSFDLDSLPPTALSNEPRAVQVTVAAKCFQPLTIASVAVDTFRAELSPVNSPACAEGNPQLSGGATIPPLVLEGQLVWDSGLEFIRGPWTNVPVPQGETQTQAAYLFEPSGNPSGAFQLPRADRVITPSTPGRIGYEFQWVTRAGNRTVYALAGIEDRSVNPPEFTAYAMGSVHGIYGEPGETVEDVSIAMNRTLDQRIRLGISTPVRTTRGPDRVATSVAVQLPDGGYALLPDTGATLDLTAASGLSDYEQLSIIGLPALVGTLAGGRYVARAQAVSDQPLAPTSILPSVFAPNPTETIQFGPFVPTPTLIVGTNNGWEWNYKLGVTLPSQDSDSTADAGTSPPVNSPHLIRYRVSSGQGQVAWTIVTPPGTSELQLPDLSNLAEGGLIPGPLTVSVSVANIPGFDLNELRTADYNASTWRAYSTDTDLSRLPLP